jgi:hypothetical protein
LHANDPKLIGDLFRRLTRISVTSEVVPLSIGQASPTMVYLGNVLLVRYLKQLDLLLRDPESFERDFILKQPPETDSSPTWTFQGPNSDRHLQGFLKDPMGYRLPGSSSNASPSPAGSSSTEPSHHPTASHGHSEATTEKYKEFAETGVWSDFDELKWFTSPIPRAPSIRISPLDIHTACARNSTFFHMNSTWRDPRPMRFDLHEPASPSPVVDSAILSAYSPNSSTTSLKPMAPAAENASSPPQNPAIADSTPSPSSSPPVSDTSLKVEETLNQRVERYISAYHEAIASILRFLTAFWAMRKTIYEPVHPDFVLDQMFFRDPTVWDEAFDAVPGDQSLTERQAFFPGFKQYFGMDFAIYTISQWFARDIVDEYIATHAEDISHPKEGSKPVFKSELLHLPLMIDLAWKVIGSPTLLEEMPLSMNLHCGFTLKALLAMELKTGETRLKSSHPLWLKYVLPSLGRYAIYAPKNTISGGVTYQEDTKKVKKPKKSSANPSSTSASTSQETPKSSSRKRDKKEKSSKRPAEKSPEPEEAVKPSVLHDAIDGLLIAIEELMWDLISQRHVLDPSSPSKETLQSKRLTSPSSNASVATESDLKELPSGDKAGTNADKPINAEKTALSEGTSSTAPSSSDGVEASPLTVISAATLASETQGMWEEMKTVQGQTYYYNRAEGLTQWTRPSDIPPPPPLPPAQYAPIRPAILVRPSNAAAPTSIVGRALRGLDPIASSSNGTAAIVTLKKPSAVPPPKDEFEVVRPLVQPWLDTLIRMRRLLLLFAKLAALDPIYVADNHLYGAEGMDWWPRDASDSPPIPTMDLDGAFCLGGTVIQMVAATIMSIRSMPTQRWRPIALLPETYLEHALHNVLSTIVCNPTDAVKFISSPFWIRFSESFKIPNDSRFMLFPCRVASLAAQTGMFSQSSPSFASYRSNVKSCVHLILKEKYSVSTSFAMLLIVSLLSEDAKFRDQFTMGNFSPSSFSHDIVLGFIFDLFNDKHLPLHQTLKFVLQLLTPDVSLRLAAWHLIFNKLQVTSYVRFVANSLSQGAEDSQIGTAELPTSPVFSSVPTAAIRTLHKPHFYVGPVYRADEESWKRLAIEAEAALKSALGANRLLGNFVSNVLAMMASVHLISEKDWKGDMAGSFLEETLKLIQISNKTLRTSRHQALPFTLQLDQYLRTNGLVSGQYPNSKVTINQESLVFHALPYNRIVNVWHETWGTANAERQGKLLRFKIGALPGNGAQVRFGMATQKAIDQLNQNPFFSVGDIEDTYALSYYESGAFVSGRYLPFTSNKASHFGFDVSSTLDITFDPTQRILHYQAQLNFNKDDVGRSPVIQSSSSIAIPHTTSEELFLVLSFAGTCSFTVTIDPSSVTQ